MNNDMPEKEKTRIVILGAGFGGIYTYLNLHRQLHSRSDIEIVIVNETDHFLFVPLIHEVATGNLLPSSVRQSVRTVPQCCLNDLIIGTVHAVDFDNQTVQYTAERKEENPEELEEETISYDYLVSALGSDTNYFGTPGAEEHALPLKRLEHAVDIKNTILERFEEAETLSTPEEKRAQLRFVIVGGGATGTELAGEIGDLLSNEIQDSFPKLAEYSSVVLIEAGDGLVKNMGKWFSRKTQDILEKNPKVEVHLNTSVKEVMPTGVRTEDEFMYAETVIWAAGVRAQRLEMSAEQDVPLEAGLERIHVTDCLHTKNYPNVFVVGDQAWIENKETGQPYPMRAQFAVREGKIAARNIKHQLEGTKCEEFEWQDMGFIVSLGKGGALARFGRFHLSGLLAWFVYRFAYLSKLLGVRAKFRTALEWMLNFFTPRDISKL